MSEVAFLAGRTVVDVRLNPGGDSRIIFDLGDKPVPALYADVDVRNCTFSNSDGQRQTASKFADPSVASLAVLVGKVVAATATDEASLSVSFTDGSSLFCAPDPDYESWVVVGGFPQFLVVCPSGGGELTVWDESSPKGTVAPEDLWELIASLADGQKQEERTVHVTSFTDPRQLGELNGVIHDCWFLVAGIHQDERGLVIPFASQYANPPRDARFDSVLRIGSVVSWRMVDDAQTGAGQFNYLSFDASTNRITVEENTAVSIEIEVERVAVSVEIGTR